MEANENKLPEVVNVEEIMQQIRKEILEKQTTVGQGGAPLVPTGGKRFSPEFYEHLYRAAMAHDQLTVTIHVTKVSIPILGPVIEWVRTKLHELVLFYVNQIAIKQIEVNTHLMQAISVLSQDLEREAEA